MTDEADDRLGQLAQRWQTDKSPRVALQLAEEYRRQERYDEAADVLEESLAEHPQSISGRVALGRVLLDGERDQQAAEVLGEVIDNDPTQLVATKLLVEAFIRLGRADDARERLRYYGLLNDSDPDTPELRRRIGALTADDPSSLDDTRAPGAEPPAPAAAAAADSDDSEEEEDVVDDPFALDAPAPPPVPVATADDDDPFPDLTDEAEPVAVEALEDDDPFDFLAPARQEEPATVVAEEPPAAPASLDDDPFELAAAPAAPAMDEDDLLASVLDDTVGAVPTPLPELEPALEPGTAPVLDEEPEIPEPALAAETAPSVPSIESDATATLGQLYMRQGHLDDAEEIFRQVLDRDPSHEAARAGLDQVAERRREVDAAKEAEEAEEAEQTTEPDRPELSAEDLLAGDRPDGLTAKKRLLFERYLERIRRSADADVH